MPPHFHFSAPSPHSMSPADTPLSAPPLCGQQRLSAHEPQPIWLKHIDPGRGEAGGKPLPLVCVCVCLCVCGAGGGPFCHTKAQVVLFKLAEAGCVEAPFHQWVLGPNRCFFEYVHSAFHLLSPG